MMREAIAVASDVMRARSHRCCIMVIETLDD